MRPKRTSISTKNLSIKGIPKEFHDKTLKDFNTYGNPDLDKIKAFIGDYLLNIHDMFDKNKGLYLLGSNGVGKSFIASLIIKEAYIHRYTSKRATFHEIINGYTKVWNAKTVEARQDLEEEYYQNFKSREFLALEEIGKELDTKLSPVVLEDLLRYREDNGLVTIICTNLTKENLIERYGKSISSLIQGNFIPIKMVGKDKRPEYFQNRGDRYEKRGYK